MALPDDGRLEVVTITAATKFVLTDRVRGVYTGRHLQEPTVHHFPCSRIELSLGDEAPREDSSLMWTARPLAPCRSR
jgi:diacylglycerol kinase family enzyme